MLPLGFVIRPATDVEKFLLNYRNLPKALLYLSVHFSRFNTP